MKAVRKATLSWESVRAAIKIMPLVDAVAHKIPGEIEVHGECNQEVGSQELCPECKKPFEAKFRTTCPKCKETFEAELQGFCSECNAQVESPTVERWCPICKKKIQAEDIKKVFPVRKNRLMELTEEEKEEWQKTFPDREEIKVVSACRKRNINPVYFLTTYTLVPDTDKKKRGEFGYEFFKEVLADDELVLITDVVISRGNYRAIIAHEKGRLLLITLVNHDEITWPDIPEIKLPPDLIERGKDTMFKMADRQFMPRKYARNPFRDHYEDLVTKKIKDKEVVPKPPIVPFPEEVKQITNQIEANLLLMREEAEKVAKKKVKKAVKKTAKA